MTTRRCFHGGLGVARASWARTDPARGELSCASEHGAPPGRCVGPGLLAKIKAALPPGCHSPRAREQGWPGGLRWLSPHTAFVLAASCACPRRRRAGGLCGGPRGEGGACRRQPSRRGWRPARTQGLTPVPTGEDLRHGAPCRHPGHDVGGQTGADYASSGPPSQAGTASFPVPIWPALVSWHPCLTPAPAGSLGEAGRAGLGATHPPGELSGLESREDRARKAWAAGKGRENLASWPGHPFLPLCTPLCLCRPDVGATARPGGHTWPCPAVWQDGKRVKSPAVAGIQTAVVPSVIRGTSPSFQLPQPPGAAQPVAGAPRASQTCASQDRSALVTWGFLRLNQLHGNKMKNSVS